MAAHILKAGITIGDINGIGMEIIIKTFMDNRMIEMCTPIVYGSSKLASCHRKVLDITNFSFNIIKEAGQANTKRANLINCWEEDVKVDLGISTKIAGAYALKSLDAAIHDLLNNKIDVLVTAPINKANIQSDTFHFAGHTEYLAEKAGKYTPLMLMIHEKTKIGVATNHIPISQVSSALNSAMLFDKIQVLIKSIINDFGIKRPKIAVLGLNPHAGDNGLIGEEEQTIIFPAIEKAKEQGHLVFGPYSGDGFFGSALYSQFDAVLSMYHDQGLIPFKIFSFDEGVNYTAGLPFVRTSPDHGTAYEIAGKNVASESSFRNAVYVACDIYQKRKRQKEWSANPLPTAKASDEYNQ